MQIASAAGGDSPRVAKRRQRTEKRGEPAAFAMSRDEARDEEAANDEVQLDSNDLTTSILEPDPATTPEPVVLRPFFVWPISSDANFKEKKTSLILLLLWLSVSTIICATVGPDQQRSGFPDSWPWVLSIYPRTGIGLLGVIFAPLFHSCA